MSNKPDTPETLEVPVWWGTGTGMMYNRSCLSSNHPESTYQYIKNMGHKPEDYGYYRDEDKATEGCICFDDMFEPELNQNYCISCGRNLKGEYK